MEPPSSQVASAPQVPEMSGPTPSVAVEVTAGATATVEGGVEGVGRGVGGAGGGRVVVVVGGKVVDEVVEVLTGVGGGMVGRRTVTLSGTVFGVVESRASGFKLGLDDVI